MFQAKSAFSGFSIDDVAKAKEFYEKVLGLEVQEEGPGFRVVLPGGGTAFAYQKEGHQPASYTMLNFVVDDIDAAVKELKSRGVQFEHYKDIPGQDEEGIMRGQKMNMGPDIAWFTDPAGNVLAVLQD